MQDKDRGTSWGRHNRTKFSHSAFKLFEGYTVQLMQAGHTSQTTFILLQ